jgi:hypothetical protein
MRFLTLHHHGRGSWVVTLPLDTPDELADAAEYLEQLAAQLQLERDRRLVAVESGEAVPIEQRMEVAGGQA